MKQFISIILITYLGYQIASYFLYDTENMAIIDPLVVGIICGVLIANYWQVFYQWLKGTSAKQGADND